MGQTENELKFAIWTASINNQIAGGDPMKWTAGKVVAVPFALMAAIPIAIGAVIFAPIYVPIALVCSKMDRSGGK
jgi:hypothetical protein